MPTFMTRDGVNISFHDTGGAGQPLVLLHGWMQTQESFRHQATGLPTSSRIITVDFRGHGRSDKPRHGYRIARLAMDVAELLDHLELRRVDALGWSMGASVWWSFIDHFGTGRLRRLVIVDQPSVLAALPWLSGPERADSGAMFDLPSLEKLVESLLGANAEQILEGFARGTYQGEITAELWDFMITEMRHTPPTPQRPFSSTTACRTGETFFPGSTCQRSSSGVKAATSLPAPRATSASRSQEVESISSRRVSRAHTSHFYRIPTRSTPPVRLSLLI